MFFIFFKMRFDIISLFPESFTSYFGVSILKRAQEARMIAIHTHNLRDFTHDKHKTVDDTPYGGGAGMVLKVEPLAEAIEFVQALKPEKKTRTILFSAKGKKFTQSDARRLSQYERLVLICGRYEGIDERVAENFADEELSIGEYVLTGGEIPSMVVVDAVARLLPGVLGNAESAETESHEAEDVVEYPQYTKPEEFRGHRVPEVLLSGHHNNIQKWREEESKKESQKRSKKISTQ
ncbi:MAG: tRNA (guanosine(37)-N1)-methyltransferase TrmD [Candidatus Moraniibacteriota bacterium]